MKQYKFRAWFTDGDAEVLCGQVCSEQEDRTLHEFLHDIEDCCDEHGYNYILMQYIGLHDKKGVEIYCGDIITSRDDLSVVVWSDDMACYLYENPRWSKNQHGWQLTCDVACEVEVIGNIHQHPDLLK